MAIADTDRLAALDAEGLGPLSVYYARTIEPTAPVAITEVAIPGYEPKAAAHTFRGQAFSPELPGALVITGADGGYLIGSPSTTSHTSLGRSRRRADHRRL